MISKENKSVSDLCDFVPKKIWFTLGECCELKGINYKTACNRLELQPNKGHGETVGGRKMFRRDTVLKWMLETDYH